MIHSGWKISLAAAALLPALYAQSGKLPKEDAEWPTYNHDLSATRYSPLTQINTKNVGKLKQAWTYTLKDPADENSGSGSEFTPLVVKGVMYLIAANRVVALEPESGKELWRYVAPKGTRPGRRSIAYWPGDKDHQPRVVFTTGRYLMALNAASGKMEPGFGNEGKVDMGVPYDSAPVVYKDMLIVGANTGEAPAHGQAGNTRAYDANTGAKKWESHSVPQAGEPGVETWEGDSWKDRSGVNNWGFSLTIDVPRGIVYTVYGGPNTNYWGGDRHGNNLYANSIVALDAETGKMKWHFQAVHHDTWDYDLPPVPALLDVTIKGKKVPILAQTTKSGYMYLLNRVTGEPVFGVKETPVPASTAPGEQSSPTQPIPVKPPPIARNSYKPEDIVTAADTTEEHAKFCRDLVERSGGFYNAGPFTPYVYKEEGAKPHSTILFPGSVGGTNWGGVAADPKLGYVFVNTLDEASIGWLEKKATGSVPYDRNSILGPASRFWSQEGNPRTGNIFLKTGGESAMPCQKPPWGRLIAVNANTGDFAWQVPLGVTDSLPEGKRNTGRLSFGGPITTAGGLVFIGATNDRRFRAFDSRTGKELWVTKLPISAHAVPITYEARNGKQYVAIVAAGGSQLDEPVPPGTEQLMVYALP